MPQKVTLREAPDGPAGSFRDTINCITEPQASARGMVLPAKTVPALRNGEIIRSKTAP
jgi:hypothetical protein